ncbi:DUF1800 domain-containing protein [Nocardia arthritidis]|uniref:DUF1800 family protein n=1 Tax=Nocardia arthritidis TaxID=228602 RepID=A0A6G9YR15_9NOCA|nr:DUF1800 domain-containing protein [Nocardia arthritidis]QIS15343.1 DUF1800 family protein [Nocardia arthritidis]
MGTQSAQWIHTARMLRRAGFGATGPEIDAVQRQNPADYLRAALAADPDADPGAQATPLPVYAKPKAPGKAAQVVERKQYRAQLTDQLTGITVWWLRRMAAVRQPVHEKLTLLWHNHFATSAAKVRDARALVAQNQKFRTLGTGDFGALAYAMLTDAAMLRWLDGTSNSAKAPNENLSREFMELFALGHGNGYTETDVREGARALTGWTIDGNDAVTLNAKRHDSGSKTLLGVTGSLGAREFCDIVLARPESARYVAGRMWQQLGSDAPPSAQALDRAVAAYGPGRNGAALVVAILTDDEFAAAHNTVVHGPIEWLVGAVRALGVPLTADADAQKLTGVLRSLGQLPFYPPNVGGWPRGQAWMSTAAAQIRLTAATALVKKADLSRISSTAPADRIDAVGYQLGIGAWSDRSAKVLATMRDDPAKLTAVALNTPEYLTS